MTELSVWAPKATRVEAILRDRTVAMKSSERGWWRAETSLEYGDDYAFSLDGGKARPDPRSPWQPEGVHGPSHHVDHSRFVWTDAHWRSPLLSSAVIYELHVGTFTLEGTFEAAIDRIDNALMWLRDYHFDGLRIDAVHAMFDRSAVHFLEELTARVRAYEAQTQRSFWVVAESDLPWCSPRRSYPCCSWARNGEPRRHSSSSPITTPTWVAP